MASRKRSYTKNEVLTLLNDSKTESDSELDSSMDSNDSDDRAEADADTGSDDSDTTIIVDVVDDVTWSSVPVNNMKRLDFTGNSGLKITLQLPEDPLAYFESFLT